MFVISLLGYCLLTNMYEVITVNIHLHSVGIVLLYVLMKQDLNYFCTKLCGLF